MRVTKGVAYAVDEHLARLEHSADEIYRLALPHGLSAQIDLEASTLRKGRLRVELTPGYGGMTANIHPGEHLETTGLRLKSVTVENWNGAHNGYSDHS